jgi:uncharacterized CHY-type Zn-finger protein
MAKITISHLSKFYKEFIDEKISISRMVEKLNEVAEDKTICKSCKKELDAHALKETELCTSCFTSNA